MRISVMTLCLLVFFSSEVMAQNKTTISVNVGSVANMEDSVGKMMLSCIEMAISYFYETNSHFQTRLVLHTRDSRDDVVGAAAAAAGKGKERKKQNRKATLGSNHTGEGDSFIIIDEQLLQPIRDRVKNESGVSMAAPIKDNNHKSAWIFMKPLTWDLWVATFCFFVFIGFSIWVLEHRVNEEFKGFPSHQSGTCFWCSFSTMVFSQKTNFTPRARKMKMKTNKILIIIIMIIFFLISSLPLIEMKIEENKTVVDVGVVVDMDNPVGEMGLSCIRLALSDFYETHSNYSTRLQLHTRDSMEDVIGAAAKAVDLIKNAQVQAIIGPVTSMQADILIKIGEKSQVPIISYSATSPSLTSIPRPYFFRATKNDSSQVNAIAAIVQAFGWRQAVLVYIDNEFGQGIVPYLIDSLLGVDARVPYRSTISPEATDDHIVQELYKLMTMQTRVFIVHLPPKLGSQFFSKVREVGMMIGGYVWITTDGVTDFLSSRSPYVLDSMQGVLGVRPYLANQEKLENFRVRWKRKFVEDNPRKFDAELNVYGLWAYDTAIALAMAVEKVAEFGFEKLGNGNGNVSSNDHNSTDLENLGVSRNGPSLIRALSNTRFDGLTGKFVFCHGQISSPVLEVVNVNGHSARGIGFWTPRNGLVRNLNTSTSSSNNLGAPSSNNLGTIIWPGISLSDPKGWEIPTNGNILKIGVPVKIGFTEFVKVTSDDSISPTGYCIDIFDAVVKALPYALTYNYTHFAGSYDDLVEQVFLKKFDAVVGDPTITAKRSLHVDFTLPYTESGVSMVVPIKDNNHKSAWIFMKPLTWDLWVATFCFFVFIGFSIWVLEHRVNEEFRGSPSHQAGTCFWFSFSTMVFSQRERLVSNLARTLAIIWFFVVLILTQSYTASLTSLLTVQKLQPTVTDVNQLIRNHENVGYLNGSFVLGILIKLGFEESNLKIYNSVEELHELFTKGSKNGGISAALDEVPYMKPFLAQYCTKYTMVEPTFLTAGFGFAFPKGSPLVPDISRALLTVKEGDQMKKIQEKWFGKQKTCPDPNTSVSSNSLSLQSFWGLFLLAGLASILALMVFLTMFVYEHRQVLISPESEGSTWTRILYLFKIFDQKDLKSHTFKNNNEQSITESNSTSPSPE